MIKWLTSSCKLLRAANYSLAAVPSGANAFQCLMSLYFNATMSCFNNKITNWVMS